MGQGQRRVGAGGAVRPSPSLVLPARAVFRGHTVVPAAGFPPPRACTPSSLARHPLRSGRRAADKKSALVRSGPRRARRSGSRVVLTAAFLPLSRAVRPASTALPFLAGAGTGGGDQRPRQRPSELWPVPPPAGRADPHRGRRGGSTQRVSGVLSGASPRRRDLSAEAQRRRQLAALWRGCCGAGRLLGGGRPNHAELPAGEGQQPPQSEEGPAQRPGRQPDFPR